MNKPITFLNYRFLFFLIAGTLFLGTYRSQAQATLNTTSIDSYYRTGLELFDKQKYGAAQKAFDEYVRLSKPSTGIDLKRVDAEYYAAISGLYLYNPDAETRIERFIAAHPNHPKAVNAYYELGLFYFSQKEYAKAIEYFEKIDTDALDTQQRLDVKFKLAYTYFSKQDFTKSGKLFNELKSTNHKYTAVSNYYAGYINYKNGNYDEALKDLKKAEQDPTYKTEVPYMIANVYYKQKKYDELLAYTETVLASGQTLKNSDEIYLLAAESHFRRGNYEKAAPYFKEYAKKNKTKPAADIQYRLAYSQYQTKDYAGATENFKNIAASRDTLGQYAAYYLGMAYLKTNNKNFALTAFDQARKGKNSKEVQQDAAFNYVKVLYDLGNNAEAITALKEFLKTYPKSRYESEANELLGEAYLNSNNYSEAIAHIESIDNRTPRINAAYQRVTFNQGVANFNNERFREAVAFFDKSLQAPNDADLVMAANFWKGEAYSVGRQYPEAINSYSAVFRKAEGGSKSTTDDYALKSRYGIGYAYYNTKEYEKALLHFQEYTNRLKTATNKLNYDDALIRLADCYYVGKKYEDALKTYDLAIKQNTNDKDYAYYQRGLILGLLGRDTEAQASLENVSKSPQSRFYDDAIFQKAQLEFEKGSYASAIAQFSSLIDQKPNSSLVPYALQKRAIAHSNLQAYDKAIADYKRILDQYPTHSVANSSLLGLQEALSSAGRPEEFNDVLAKYKKANPEDTSLENVEFEAAKSLYFSEKYQKAVQGFETYLKTYPNNALVYDARYYLADSYYRLNDRPNAIKYFTAVIADNRSQFVSRAVQRTAELEFANKNYPNAIKNYLTFLPLARNKKEQSISWMGLMESYYNIGKYDSVVFYSDELITKGNATLSAQNKALLYRGKAAYAQNDYPKAIDEFLRTLNSAKDEYGAEAQYLMAEALYKQNQFKPSLDALFQLNSQFGSYEKWRAKGFLLIADNYISLNEFFQAKATLNSIIDNSKDKDIVAQAKEKLKTIQDKD